MNKSISYLMEVICPAELCLNKLFHEFMFFIRVQFLVLFNQTEGFSPTQCAPNQETKLDIDMFKET